MDSITNMFQGANGPNGWLAKLFQSPLLKVGLAGSGTLGNILANRSRNQVLNQQIGYTKYLQNLTPDQVTRMISQYQKPLSSNLINNVTNTVQGQMASRGLAQAPGIFSQGIAQGLAPYEVQEQQLAQDALFKKLGLPISSKPSPFGPFPQTTNTSQLWQSLMQNFMGIKPPNTGGASAPSENNLINSLWPGVNPGVDSWLPFLSPGLTGPPIVPPSSDTGNVQYGGG